VVENADVRVTVARVDIGYHLKVDVDSIYIERDEVDVLPIIREIFISNLPINPVCSPDCKGICPVCGLRIEDEAEHLHEEVEKTRKLGVFLEKALKEGGKQ